MELPMNARERLQKLQAALDERGVKDVKFFFNSMALGGPTAAAASAAEVLEAFLNGQCTNAEEYIQRAA